MEQELVHRVAGVVVGLVVTAVIFVLLPEPVLALSAGVLWAAGTIGVLRGYRRFPEWAQELDLSRNGFLMGVGALAFAKGVVVYAFLAGVGGAPTNEAVWLGLTLAGVIPLAAAIGVFIVESEQESGDGAAV